MCALCTWVHVWFILAESKSVERVCVLVSFDVSMCLLTPLMDYLLWLIILYMYMLGFFVLCLFCR